MTPGPKRALVGLTGLALAASLGLSSSAPASAQPDIGDVKAQVDRLYQQAEVANEHYHDSQIRLTQLKHDLASLRSDQERQQSKVDGVRSQLQNLMLGQYEGQSMSALGQVVLSRDTSDFLDQMTTMSSYDDTQASLLESYRTEARALELRRQATQQRVDEISSVTRSLARDKQAVATRLDRAKSLLSTLQERQREQVVSRSTTSRSTTAAVPASGRAAAAVQYAMAQVGDAYVYGAAGPDAFDCSGLTMMAWAAAGVSLPHSSSAQYSSGPHIAESDLQPGDLVFFYSPISHVGMYIGNGMVVHAANPSDGVEVSPLHSMPYSGAVRPG